ncbi:serine/threonine-protein kinase [Chondromyces apiculatus]|uniref:Protein kinase domain-containing protein n=1 Tax=Chondromyces apiculatus DSM 436 TaxID=1192034 RepID=A0A017TJI3_9BACT|nr:serine/threonine-protein kinase [Chondromyces apiculatus]EYF08801.1 Hypothetical protein CAP_2662 [Chondromyces apiculatus DSM 436]
MQGSPAQSQRRSQPPPELIAGRYRVEGRVGAGAIGLVVLATDLETSTRVAVKKFDPARLQSTRAADRLLRSARAAMALTGEHIARVLDCGELPDGAPFVVTEYLEGCHLGAYVERRGPMGPKAAVKHLLQACEAVAAAHAVGIVHRDLKPQNLFLTFSDAGQPSIKVLDFGTHAVACGAEGEGALGSSSMHDSLLYMAPEQLRSGGKVDERADLWSLGGIGYLLLLARGPFDAEEPLEIMAGVLDKQPPPIPADLKAGGLEKVLRRCLEKQPDQRHANVAELALALSRFGGEKAQSAAAKVWEIRSAPSGPSSGAGSDGLPIIPDLDDGSEPPPSSSLLASVASELGVDDPARITGRPPAPRNSAPPRQSHAPASEDVHAAHVPVIPPMPRAPSIPPPSRSPASRNAAPPPAGHLASQPPHASARGSMPPAARPAVLQPRTHDAPSRPPSPPLAPAAHRRRRMLEIASVSLLAVALLSIWLVRGRILTFDDGGTSASAKTGIATHTIEVMRAWVARRDAVGSVGTVPRPTIPGPSVPTPSPSAAGLPAAPDPVPTAPAIASQPAPPDTAPTAPGLTPPPGGWEYPPEIIYDEVERERRRLRALEEAARRKQR